MGDSQPKERGRDAVRGALLAATRSLLAERGVSRFGVRDIAELAGVNKGQIHHYFGGKQGLVDAAFLELAAEQYARTAERAGGPIPVPLSFGENPDYVQALVRLILDGELATATSEIGAGVSVSRRAINTALEKRSVDVAPAELKAVVAFGLAVELGWAAFSEYILTVVDVTDDAEEQAMAEIMRAVAMRSRELKTPLAPDANND